MFKEWRKKTGLTQIEVARKLKFNVGFWCRVEQGRVDLPPKHYKRVANILGVPVKTIVNFRIKKFAERLKAEAQ